MRTHAFPHSVPEGARTAGAAPTAIWLWLTLPLALLVALTSTAGLLVPGVYHGVPAWTVQAIAQDFIDLFLVLPVLIGSAVLAARGSRRARLVWLGTLSYVVYAFVIYAFAVPYNQLFLIYVAALGCALWALIGGLATTDWQAIKAHFAGTTPVRLVSLFLLVPAAIFALLWLSDEVPALLAGTVPASIADMGVLTNPVHVIDLSLLLPAMMLVGIWLWRKQAPGYGLAAVLLMNVLFQDLGIAVLMVFSLRAGLPGGVGPIALFFGLASVNLALQAWYLRELRAPAR